MVKTPSLPWTWARGFSIGMFTPRKKGLLLLSQPEPKYSQELSACITLSWSIIIRHHLIIMAVFSPLFWVIFKEPSSSLTAANNVKWKDEVVAFQWMSLIGWRKRYGNLHPDEFFRECLTENQSSRNHKGGHPLVMKISSSKVLRENKTCNKSPFYTLVMLPKDSLSQKTSLDGYDCTRKIMDSLFI